MATRGSQHVSNSRVQQQVLRPRRSDHAQDTPVRTASTKREYTTVYLHIHLVEAVTAVDAPGRRFARNGKKRHSMTALDKWERERARGIRFMTDGPRTRTGPAHRPDDHRIHSKSLGEYIQGKTPCVLHNAPCPSLTMLRCFLLAREHSRKSLMVWVPVSPCS